MKVFLACCALLATLWPLQSAQAECPAADAAWRSGRLTATARQARRCLRERPDDPGALFALSRVQSARGAHDRALRTLERALDEHPEDRDLRLWKARVLYWAGEYDRAWEVVRLLPYTAPEDSETARLRASLAFARGDWEKARYGYRLVWAAGGTDAVVRRNHGLANLAMGEQDFAMEDFVALANRGDRHGLGLARSHASWRASLQPGWISTEGDGTGWLASAALSHRADDGALWLGGRVERRVRHFASEPAVDTWFETQASWRGPGGLLLEGAAGGSPRADYSPVGAVWLEPGWAPGGVGMELRVRLWQMWFSESVASVVSPAVLLYLGPVDLYGRSYHTWDGQAEPGLFWLARLGLRPADRWQLSVLGGIGDRADYLLPRQVTVEQSWVTGGGLLYDLSARASLQLDGRFRHEQSAGVHYEELRLDLGINWYFQ